MPQLKETIFRNIEKRLTAYRMDKLLLEEYRKNMNIIFDSNNPTKDCIAEINKTKRILNQLNN
jgi:hypothetical protein